jgi:hypothetical protein
LIIRFNVTGTGTGTLTGSFDGTEMDVVHPDGSITLEGRLVFTGSVGTRTGTLLVTYNGIGNINRATKICAAASQGLSVSLGFTRR